jgi:hypothetical protein
MILDQLQIAPEIVTITYAALMGMLALAGALAFGLGGRDVAARMLEEAYSSGRDNVGRVRRDAQLGRERAEREASTHTQRFDRGAAVSDDVTASPRGA